MTLFALTTRASNGGNLTADQVDANWTAIVNAIIVLQSLVPALTFASSADGRSLLVSVNGTLASTVPLPAGPLNDKGAYGVGVVYHLGDMFTFKRSTYRVIVASYTSVGMSGATPADVAAGNVTLLAGAGGPGYTLQGPYNPATAYNLGDGVTMPWSTSTVWVLSVAAPAGTSPPTSASGTSAYWAVAAICFPFSTAYSKDPTQAVGQDVVNANIIAGLKAINTQLAANHAAGFPLTFAFT